MPRRPATRQVRVAADPLAEGRRAETQPAFHGVAADVRALGDLVERVPERVAEKQRGPLLVRQPREIAAHGSWQMLGEFIGGVAAARRIGIRRDDATTMPALACEMPRGDARGDAPRPCLQRRQPAVRPGALQHLDERDLCGVVGITR